MKRLSSPVTPWNKHLYPLLPLAVLAGLGMVFWRHPEASIDPRIMGLIAAISVVAILPSWFLLRGLIDEVWMTDNGLLLRARGEEVRIVWSQIESISSTRWLNPPRVTVHLKRDCRFGRRFVFNPTWRAFELTEHPVVAELRQHIDTRP